MDFAARERRFQDVRRVDGAFGPAGSDERVHFVDEENRILRATHFVHQRFDALFELTAVLRPGDHHRQVEDDDALVHQDFRDVSVDDALREPFDDRRLADARLAEENRIVFRSAT